MMSDANLYYTELLLCIKAELRVAGFKKRGSAFIRAGEEVISIVSIQKSRDFNPGSLKVTVNIGAYSRRLGRMLSGFEPKTVDFLDCHLSTRIGSIQQPPEDKWWVLESLSSRDTAIKDIVDKLSSCAIPYLNKFSTDQSLIDLWKGGVSPGLTDVQRERYLAKLLSAQG